MRRTRRVRRPPAVVTALLAVGSLAACSAGSSDPTPVPSASASFATQSPTSTPSPSTTPTPTPPATPTRPVAASCLRVVVLGSSVRGRSISACERGTPGGRAFVVIGVIHGDERIGLGVVQRLRSMTVPAGVDLWLIDSMNPDGVASGTRANGRGVDLNRNFGYHWARSSTSGTSPLSEPESRAVAAFLLARRPHTVVVLHSPLAAVDFSEGADPAAVRSLAAVAGFPARRLGARAGELTGWYNAQPWRPSAITFEFGASASAATVDRVARAVLTFASWRTLH